MPKARTVAWVSGLAKVAPGIQHLLAEHLSEHGELLPHLVMGDICRYVMSCFEPLASGGERLCRDEAIALLGELETAMKGGDDDIQEVISVSFLEGLVWTDPIELEMWRYMGPALREEVDRYYK